MKKIILIISLLAVTGGACFAQCDKNLVLTSSKTEHLNAEGKLLKTDDEKAVIRFGKSSIAVSVNDEPKLSGVIKSETCSWSIPFKEGKTVIKATLTSEQGEKNATFTIEGKDGKVMLLFEMEGMPDDRIRVGIDKFVVAD